MYEAWAMVVDVELPPLYGNGIQHVRWDIPRDQDRVYLMYDIVDADADDRLAWGTALVRRGEMSVEELYVKPSHRRKGFGRKIAESFIVDASGKGLPIRFSVPFADVDDRQKVAELGTFFCKLGLGFEPSPYQSAAFCAVMGGSNDIPEFTLPPKAAYVFQKPIEPSVDWERLKHEYNLSHEFIADAKSVFGRHGEVLRRLAQ
jgi:GNAT superfamily N-acetyltransferase